MTDKTHIILIRHGETEENRKGILQGHNPGRLTHLGISQAEQLTEMLADKNFEVVVCSDLKRSTDTAMIISSSKGLHATETVMLRERDWGIYTGKKASDVVRPYDDSVESDEHLYIRASMILDWIRYSFNGKRVLVIGHGCINNAILAKTYNLKPEFIETMPLMEHLGIEEFDI